MKINSSEYLLFSLCFEILVFDQHHFPKRQKNSSVCSWFGDTVGKNTISVAFSFYAAQNYLLSAIYCHSQTFSYRFPAATEILPGYHLSSATHLALPLTACHYPPATTCHILPLPTRFFHRLYLPLPAFFSRSLPATTCHNLTLPPPATTCRYLPLPATICYYLTTSYYLY